MYLLACMLAGDRHRAAWEGSAGDLPPQSPPEAVRKESEQAGHEGHLPAHWVPSEGRWVVSDTLVRAGG